MVKEYQQCHFHAYANAPFLSLHWRSNRHIADAIATILSQKENKDVDGSGYKKLIATIKKYYFLYVLRATELLISTQEITWLMIILFETHDGE